MFILSNKHCRMPKPGSKTVPWKSGLYPPGSSSNTRRRGLHVPARTKAREGAAKAQPKLHGEARLVGLVEESEGLREEVFPTTPSNFVHELAD